MCWQLYWFWQCCFPVWSRLWQVNHGWSCADRLPVWCACRFIHLWANSWIVSDFRRRYIRSCASHYLLTVTNSPNSRYGRRRTVQLPVVLSLIFAIVAGVAPNFYIYIVSQFIAAIGLSGYRINSVVLGMKSGFMTRLLWFLNGHKHKHVIILFVLALQWFWCLNCLCSYWMDWGQSKVLRPLSGPVVWSSWKVCYGWSGLCYSWLENSTICFGRRPGHRIVVHMVCVIYSFFFLTPQCCICTLTPCLVKPGQIRFLNLYLGFIRLVLFHIMR